MKLTLETSFLILMLLTIIGVLTSLIGSEITVIVVIIFAIVKFLLVGFHFMELKKAHSLWKFLFVFYSILIGSLMILILN